MMKHLRRGVIINIASASALLPTPLVAVYSATKAYVDFLSQALNAEYSDYGITVQVLSAITRQILYLAVFLDGVFLVGSTIFRSNKNDRKSAH